MEELRLTRPTEAMSGEISAYRQAMLDAGSEMDGCGPLSRMEDPAEWIAFCKTLGCGLRRSIVDRNYVNLKK